jgi:hypothetical protein
MISSHSIQNNSNWIINLILNDNTKISRKIQKGIFMTLRMVNIFLKSKQNPVNKRKHTIELDDIKIKNFFLQDTI